MTPEIKYVIQFDDDSQTLSIYNGKKLKTGTKVPTDATVILTTNLPPKITGPLIKDGRTILRCSEKTVAECQSRNNLETIEEAILVLHDELPLGFKAQTVEPPLVALWSIFKDYQRMRVATGNRLYQDQSDQMKDFNENLSKGEAQLKKMVEKELEKHPIYQQWLVNIKGIGPSMAGGIVALLGSCDRFRSVGALWAYSGYKTDAETGQIQKRTKGEVGNWNGKVRTQMYLIVTSFLKQKTPVYSPLYYEEKVKQLERGLKPGHAHARAMRKVAKVFLCHYWQIARQIAGLPVPNVWVIEHGGHVDVIDPPHWGANAQ